VKRQTWIGPTTLAVAVAILLWLVIPTAVGRNNHAAGPTKPTASASPAVHTLRFVTEGDVQGVAAQYTDAHGSEPTPAIDGDIQVAGLTSAAIAVTGTNITCYILLDGVTLAAFASDGPVALCAYQGP